MSIIKHNSFCRCIAVNSIGIFLYEELSHGILESKYVEAVNVLLGTLRVSWEVM